MGEFIPMTNLEYAHMVLVFKMNTMAGELGRKAREGEL